jgi:hypothetical protein
MLMVVLNEGKKFFLNNALNPSESTAPPYVVKLYSNDYTPVDGSNAGNFTEATFPGYAPVVINGDDFEAAVIVADVAHSTSVVTPSYTCTGGAGQLVYGWFMIENDFGTAILAQRFNVPRNMITGAVESLNPFKISLKTLD